MKYLKNPSEVGVGLRVTLFSGLLFGHSLSAAQVDTEIVLLVDVTGSVNRREYNAMMEGIATSFESSAVINSVSSGSLGSVAATLVFWSSSNRQQVGVSWMEISDATSAADFASLVRNSTRPFFGSSAIGSALAYAATTFGTETGGTDNGFESSRQAITIFGDGVDNSTPPRRTSREQNVRNERDGALADGVDQISAIVDSGSFRDLESYYATNVIGATGGETATVSGVGFDAASQDALNEAIALSISATGGSSVPEPSSVVLLGLAGAFLVKRRR